jgi:hypothetical protein
MEPSGTTLTSLQFKQSSAAALTRWQSHNCLKTGVKPITLARDITKEIKELIKDKPELMGSNLKKSS